MSRRTDTGDPTPYSDADEAAIEEALDDAYADYQATRPGREPTSMRVSAQIEWNGSMNRANDGYRTTTLTGLDLKPVRQALARAREASQQAGQARPATSYRAQGWQAQLRQLSATQRGRDAADRAGLTPGRRTYVAWLSGAATPNAANREKIAAAYDSVRNRRVDTARDKATTARRQLADTLSAQCREAYNGAEIRFFNITDIELRD